MSLREWERIERETFGRIGQFVPVPGHRLARRCQQRRRNGQQCKKYAVRGRQRCRSHGGCATNYPTPRGEHARALVLLGHGAAEIARATGLSKRSAFRLRAEHRAGRMTMPPEQLRGSEVRVSKQVAKERRRVERMLADLGLDRPGVYD